MVVRVVGGEVGLIPVPGEGDGESTEAEEGDGCQEGGQGTQLESLGQEAGEEAGRDSQEPVIEGHPGESPRQPGWGEVVGDEVLLDVPGLEGGAEEGGGQPPQHPPQQQHQEVTPDLAER